MDKDLECEVLVIGSGAGGGPLAYTLASAGVDVIVLEKGPRHPRSAYAHDETEVHRRGFFAPSLDEDPHMVLTPSTTEPQRTDLGWIASCVGGGTVHMGAYFYRFHPDDFRMKSRFGEGDFGDPIVENLVDWPFDYDELEPFYDLAEREVGVSGLAGGNPFEGPRSAPYPLPPLDSHPIASMLEDAIRQRGGHPFHTPRAINSRPYQGRPSCAYCSVCGSYGCPVGARGSVQEALLPRAEATGHCRVIAEAMVREITVDDQGLATGCRFSDADGQDRTVTAKIVCVCCSAVESARLLLLSSSTIFPEGLANRSGQVGKHLQFHGVTMGAAWLRRDRLPATIGDTWHPFLGRSMMDHYFLPEGVSELAKGGMIRFFIGPPNPIETAEGMAFSERPIVWGKELRERMRSWYDEYLPIGFEIFHDFLPNSGTYTELDPEVRDKWNLPVARIHLDLPKHHQIAGQWVMDRAFEVLSDLGAEMFQTQTVGGTSRYLVHGTCRAGEDSKNSVLDPYCRTHDVANLYVVDGSFMPTSGGASPTLTILANSFRVAEHLLKRLSEI